MILNWTYRYRFALPALPEHREGKDCSKAAFISFNNWFYLRRLLLYCLGIACDTQVSQLGKLTFTCYLSWHREGIGANWLAALVTKMLKQTRGTDARCKGASRCANGSASKTKLDQAFCFY